MTFFESVKNFFRKYGSVIANSIAIAVSNGLTDDLVSLARTYAVQAASRFIEDAPKREWVVKQLRLKGLPESVARLATELGYQAAKTELDKLKATPVSYALTPSSVKA